MTGEPEQAAAEARAGGAPAAIHLPTQPQPSPGRKRGRHFGTRPIKDPRTARIDLRVTPAQRAAMKAVARGAGMSVAALICLRTLGTEGPRARRNPGPDTVLLAKLLAEMGKSGSNLNQIAARLNSYDFYGVQELLTMRATVEAALAEHRECVGTVMRALGA